jgi:signal transduction histidine kinase
MGFDLQQASSKGGVGLNGMRERAAEIGWSLKITSAPGAGTRIRVEKKLPEGGQHDDPGSDKKSHDR